MPLSPRGLVLTTSFHSGFITALFVVFVPLFSYLLEGRKPRVHQLVSLAIAVAGLYFLSKGEIGFDLGEFLTLICAILFGMHVVLVTIPPGCPRGKFAVLAVFDGLVHKWADGAYDWSQLAGIPICRMGCPVFCTNSFCIWHMGSATISEDHLQQYICGDIHHGAVFAYISSVIILGERLVGVQWIGAILLLVSTLFVSVTEAEK